MPHAHPTAFVRLAWALLGYTILVILWGAFVRATGAGAGCGSHWPLCNGEVVPTSPRWETLVELSHRVTSALVGLGVIALLVGAFRRFPRGHRVRKAAVGSFVFVLTEGLVGAMLVRYEWVADDASVARTVVIGLHLVNTFVLVAFLTAAAWWASGRAAPRRDAPGVLWWSVGALVLGALVVSTAGAVTALGDTLFRAEGSGAVLASTLDATAHHLQQLRVYHPVLAVLFGALVVALVPFVQRRAPAAHRLGQVVLLLYLAQVALGVWNIFLKAPVWMQLVHLFGADLFWIVLIMFSNDALSGPSVDIDEGLARRAARAHLEGEKVEMGSPTLQLRFEALRARARHLDSLLPDPLRQFRDLTGHSVPFSPPTP